MKPISIALVAATCLMAFAHICAAAPEDDAISRYRAYVTAVRAGKPEDAIKLIEPVPESCKPLLNARVAKSIAVEAMTKEMIAQFGPAKPAEGISEFPDDDALKNLTSNVLDPDTIVLRAKDPASNAEGTISWMVRRSTKWVVSATVVMDLEPSEPVGKFVEPEAAVLEEGMEYAQSITKAADAVFKRLRDKEFKQASEVNAAFHEEMKKARGQ